MKFTQLPIGQRFELDGAVYVKTSPMMAAREGSGESRFMARYVVVKVLGGEMAPARAKAARKVDVDTVVAAFDQTHAQCREFLMQLADEVSTESLERLLGEVDEGRKRFLAHFL